MNTALNVANLINAIGMVVIAGFMAWIGYQQYATSRRHLNWSLYDRRLKVYTAIRKVIGEVFTHGKPDFTLLAHIAPELAESHFLFDKEVTEYLEKFWQKIVEGRYLHQQMYPEDGSPGLPVGGERSEVAEKSGHNTEWFIAQGEKATDLLKPYLKIK